jgi:hypothetical protein
LRTQAAIATLDFIDNSRVLLTFVERPLMKREADPNETGIVVPVSNSRARDDRMVRAEVVDMSTGKAVQQQDWRVYDRESYLVPLGGGHFLLRQGGTLSIVDSELRRHRQGDFSVPVVRMQAGTDSGILLVETEHEVHTPEQHAEMAHEELLHDIHPAAEEADAYGWKLPLTDSGHSAPLFHALLPRAGALSGNAEGLVELSPAGRGFEIYFHPFAPDGKKRMLLKVASDCRPATQMLRQDIAMVTACKGDGGEDFGVSLTGMLLWSHATVTGMLPDVVASESGNRFAVQSVGALPGPMTAVPAEQDFAQGLVQVFDVDSGERVFATVLAPLYSAFHTVALSPDGMKLAVLRQGALEIYALPPMPDAATKKESSKK